MKAVIFPAANAISYETVPDPSCGADEVVVQVASSGICGTDSHIFRNEYLSDFPLIPGHEFGGVIVETGRGVTGLRSGQRVVVDPNLYCGHCDYCRREEANHCANWEGVGVTRSGGFAEYVNVPAKAVYPVPDSLNDTQVAFVEPLACVIWALKRITIEPGSDVLIMGSGPMGLLLLQALRHRGASRVIMVDKQAARLQLAAKLGAAQTLLAGAEQDEALKAWAPQGYGLVVDATGVPAVIEKAFQHLRVRGQFLQFGVTPMGAKIQVSPYDIFRHDWSIIGSFALCYTTLPAVAWLEAGAIDVAPLVSHRLPLAEFESGFRQFMAGETLKVHLTVGG